MPLCHSSGRFLIETLQYGIAKLSLGGEFTVQTPKNVYETVIILHKKVGSFLLLTDA